MQWKAAEREVAKFFGGRRRVRVSYDESIGDIIHYRLSIEVKYGKQIPKYLIPPQGYPTVLCVGAARYRMAHSSCIIPDLNHRLGRRRRRHAFQVNALVWGTRRIRRAKFLKDAMEQARSYNPTLKPLVCVKAKRMRGFVAIWRVR